MLSMLEVGSHIYVRKRKPKKRKLRGVETVGRILKKSLVAAPLDQVGDDSVPASMLANLKKGEALFRELGLDGVVHLLRLKCPVCGVFIKTTDSGSWRSHFVPHLQRHVLAGSEKGRALLQFVKEKSQSARLKIAEEKRHLFV